MKSIEQRIPPKAWDFRQIEDTALPNATLYEYARTSDKIRKPTIQWLQTKVKGERICEHVRKAMLDCKAMLDSRKRGMIYPGLDSYLYPGPESYPKGVWREIKTLGLKATQNLHLCDLIMGHRPDFPNAWLDFPITYKKSPHYSRAHCFPLSGVFRHFKEHMAEGSALIRRSELLRQIDLEIAVSESRYTLDIEWAGNSIKEIVANFQRWLTMEAANHPDRRQGGQPSQALCDPLKTLAAYRLHKAGATFTEATALLKPCRDFRLIPYYADKSGWSDAIRRAKRYLLKIEAGDAKASCLQSWLLSCSR